MLVVVQEVVVPPPVHLLMVVVGMEQREFQITLVDHMLVEVLVVVACAGLAKVMEYEGMLVATSA